MPDAVVVAEGKWHVALRAFREAHRTLLHDKLECGVDVPALIADMMARITECDENLEVVDKVMDETETALLKLVEAKEARAKSGAKGGKKG
eukprot:CAMPEP_0173404810 /NCGR_PEP_ID=MMETSP1356-20130122/60313_1 /TAXON_ID=77927 ORGANISM="Hemiselmis virescens, Strain PCC157" /NCGR_SAMPLE_ID=MMETSP1356 /ASSEMBLY_ACC=CAM_ASM_000847 /LENGTH=90 /DNA_ID=CAMNT_0014365537 /DNA_START=1 /DNA_END=269 /DNA_ORIENTATION=-